MNLKRIASCLRTQVSLFLLSLLTLWTGGSAAQVPAGVAAADPYQPTSYVQITHPGWSKNVVIYQINIRQFSQEGTFRGVEKQLPRLKELGVGILWVMPIQKIGLKKRKGSLGSPYAVQDYYSVNPEFGTLDDFKQLVKAAHEQGMHVILDWVANHTAWDNVLVTQHPECMRGTGRATLLQHLGGTGTTSSIWTIVVRRSAST